jgi:hypothetical protein
MAAGRGPCKLLTRHCWLASSLPAGCLLAASYTATVTPPSTNAADNSPLLLGQVIILVQAVLALFGVLHHLDGSRSEVSQLVFASCQLLLLMLVTLMEVYSSGVGLCLYQDRACPACAAAAAVRLLPPLARQETSCRRVDSCNRYFFTRMTL